jgi:hypothetical protein
MLWLYGSWNDIVATHPAVRSSRLSTNLVRLTLVLSVHSCVGSFVRAEMKSWAICSWSLKTSSSLSCQPSVGLPETTPPIVAMDSTRNIRKDERIDDSLTAWGSQVDGVVGPYCKRVPRPEGVYLRMGICKRKECLFYSYPRHRLVVSKCF